ncbi:MAG: DUF4252 domain-containing protein [Flavobacteriales bacterium]|nr:DUF4252 domain-containing protein [Flavobacteriales bacterium]
MKKLIITIGLIFSIAALSAQQNAIGNHFSNYLDREDITKISVTGKIFELAAYIEADDEETKEFKDFVSSIDFFQMIVGDEGQFTQNDYRSALGKVEREYEELMTIEDKDGDFNFRIKERNGVVREVIMLGYTTDDLIIMSISGHMDLRQLSKMGSRIQTEGFEHFKKIEDSGMDQIKIYPNPAQSGQQFNIQVPENFVGGEASLMDLNGRLVMTYPMSTKKQQLRLGSVPPGQYVMEFRSDEMTVSKKVSVK